MYGVCARMDHIVGDVHMDIGGIPMYAAMPLVLGIPQGGGKTPLYVLKDFGRKSSLVFGPEAHKQVIGLRALGAGVAILNIRHFRDAFRVIFTAKTARAPRHKTFFPTMPSVGNVRGKTGIAIMRRVYGDASADHLSILAIAACSSRCRASSSCKSR